MTDTLDAINLPFEEAISFFREKASVPTKSWRDVWGAAHSHSFSVAGAASQALVDDFRGEIDKALAEGTTLADFRKGFDDIVKKHGWEYRGERNWRTRIIFETNLRTAHAAGRYAQMTLPETLEAFPYWQYNHSGAVHPRLDHLSWDGNVWRADNAIWSIIYPPNGFGCGCYTTPVSREDLARQGKKGQDTTPRLEQPGGRFQGVDSGFAYNPGQAWLSGGRPGEKLATKKVLDFFEASAMAGELPENTSIALAKIDGRLARGMEVDEWANARASAYTLRGHVDKHGLGAQEYAEFTRDALDGTVYKSASNLFTAIVERADGDFVVGFKRGAHGEVLVVTVHKLNTRKRKQIEALPVVRRVSKKMARREKARRRAGSKP